MKYILCADQTRPRELIKKIFKNKIDKQSIINYLNILNDNNMKSNILDVLSSSGCTYAFIANVILNQFLKSNNYEYNDDEFISNFGFSLLLNEDTIDCNILMLDIFSSLYNVCEFNIHKYETYEFSSSKEALSKLFNINIEDESKAILMLFENGYNLNGKSSDGKNKYISRNCINKTFYGTYEQLGKYLFNMDINNFDINNFNELLKNNGITIDKNYVEAESKFSGLLKSESMNKWINYYFMKKGIDSKINSYEIKVSELDFDNFKDKIIDLLEKGNTIGISSNINTNSKITNEKLKYTENVSNKYAGHQMTLIEFDSNNDIVVESWGKRFLINKNEFKNYNYQCINIEFKNIENEKIR